MYYTIIIIRTPHNSNYAGPYTRVYGLALRGLEGFGGSEFAATDSTVKDES